MSFSVLFKKNAHTTFGSTSSGNRIKMGQSQRGAHGPVGDKKEEEDNKKKYEPPVPTTVGEKKKIKGTRCCQPIAIGDNSHSVPV